MHARRRRTTSMPTKMMAQPSRRCAQTSPLAWVRVCWPLQKWLVLGPSHQSRALCRAPQLAQLSGARTAPTAQHWLHAQAAPPAASQRAWRRVPWGHLPPGRLAKREKQQQRCRSRARTRFAVNSQPALARRPALRRHRHPRPLHPHHYHRCHLLRRRRCLPPPRAWSTRAR